MGKIAMLVLAVSVLLAACTSYRYGVPQETWDRMSEPERIEAMGVYEREQQARRQAAEERARRQAVERERERARQAELERARQERIEAIHRGEGAYGELLRVRLQGGRIKVGDRQQRYEPITFTIADGETLDIGVADRKGREVPLLVTYAGGALSLDGIRFPYNRHWGRGKLYADTDTPGELELRGADVFIEIHDRSSRYERQLPRLVIIREEPPPPVVVIRERDHHRPPPVIVPEKDKPKPPPVRQPEPPAAARPPRTVEVVLLAGEMKVRGQNQQVERVTLRLAEGESRTLAVKAGSGTGTLSLRYRNGELFVDGSPAKGRAAVRLPFEKEWQSGKVYRFDLKGKVPLEKVEMKVTAIEGK
ncbi:MAG: hypothetical protein H6Q56_880 [Deltaproteobacteria bacterium]|nr:hypothetical protein [Deltaproteobacteria bacterium]